MRYIEAFQLNFELFNSSGIITECIRQWVVLVASAIVIPFLCMAIGRLKRYTRNKFTFD